MVQGVIHTSPPCFEHPGSQDCHGRSLPNQVHMTAQIPAYILIGLSKIFVSATSLEYAFTHATALMKLLGSVHFHTHSQIGHHPGNHALCLGPQLRLDLSRPDPRNCRQRLCLLVCTRWQQQISRQPGSHAAVRDRLPILTKSIDSRRCD